MMRHSWIGELMERFYDEAFLDRGAHGGFSGCDVPG